MNSWKRMTGTTDSGSEKSNRRPEAPTDGIRRPEVEARHPLVDHRDARGLGSIEIGEGAPMQ